MEKLVGDRGLRGKEVTSLSHATMPRTPVVGLHCLHCRDKERTSYEDHTHGYHYTNLLGAAVL